ncbi:MAG: excinuclease ABC subunit UvrC [Candidatus Desulforudis sp.]|nr:excinuclease ABC subunit UvrC [Desulforudis sp.]
MSLADKAKHFPDKPGVYLFRGARGEVLYVGKAVSLRSRVRSYFTGAQDNKVQALVGRAADVECIVTGTDIEALILESNLIKEYRPRYNVLLKDDKSYPYLKVTVQEEYPRVFLTRTQPRDGARYFGPYPSAGAVHETLRLLKKLFPLRTCRQVRFANGRPCLNFHIGRCLGPCRGTVDPDEYRALVQEVLLFLEGRHTDLVHGLTRKMEAAAANLEFERAAELRDQLEAVNQVLARQNIVSERREDQDVMALARDGDRGRAVVLEIRGGKLLGQHSLAVQGIADRTDAEVLAAFIKQYYREAGFVPPEVLLTTPLGEEQGLIAEWLGLRRGARVRLHVPRRGRKRELVRMAEKNAALAREQMRFERSADAALAELAALLGLEEPPIRLEAFDISNIQGAQTVGAMVVFESGRPARDEYRRFKVQNRKTPDDYAAMREVVGRRFTRGREENKLIAEGRMSSKEARFHRLPDLVLIDGGKGQLGAALEAMRRTGYGEIPVFGLAKEEEQVFAPGGPEPLPVPRDSQALYLLQHLRDEAHRFAVTYHREARSREGLRSLLDEIDGIGPARRRALQKAFPSLKAVKAATIEELAAVPSMNRKAARAVYDYFHGAG